MEKTYNPALIQRTQRYMETHSISQNQFAAKVNLSSAALSSYLNQKYKGSVEAVERQLSEFFKLDEEAEAAAEKTASLLPRAAYVPTSISEDVCQSIRFAQLEHCMVVLHGDAGVGKSKGAQKFLRDHPTNAVGISITPSTGTLNGSIKLLARALRVPECRNKMDQMMALRSRLDGTNWVIVIDEAQHLKYAALEEIRSLTDDNPMTVEHGVGVVLIGNSEVYSRLQGRQQAQFAQLFSRIRMQREYTTRKVKEDDVRKLFPVLAEQDARKSRALNFGTVGYRVSSKLMLASSRVAEAIATLKVLGHAELIKTTETLDREALKRQPGDILQQVGAYIRTVDEFYYDVSSKEADA